MIDIDDDALMATVDLVGRTGARDLQIGYLHDDVPVDQAAWYAQAQYQGARIIAENHRGPVPAVEALARRLLTGAKCAHCGGLVTLSDHGAVAYTEGTLTDGTRWTVQAARKAPQCRWRRVGPKWLRGCEGRDKPKDRRKRKKKRR